MRSSTTPFLALALVLLACEPDGDTPDLLPVLPVDARVSETLAIELPVRNDAGRELRYRVSIEGPPLAAFESVTSLSGSPGRGEFRWTPLASHVGRHELLFEITSPSGERYDGERVVVNVVPSEDSAPVFLRPGAGGTHDLMRDPCVRFDVEIRDDDTPAVEIRERAPLPEGALIVNEGAKSARFEWCPTGDQIAASERWTIELEADDGDHPPVPHDYVVVLRTGPTTGCPGAAPSITLVTPLEGERVTSSSGYEVRIRVTDDVGLRDAPLLYWSRTAPDDRASPDVTAFEQVVFDPNEGGEWRARIPSLGLAEGADAEVFYLATATDNDDATGTACDHRTDSSVVAFFAVGGASTGGDLGQCSPCARSTECASGICVAAAGGARCLTSCAVSACTVGTCGDAITIEGATRRACGDVAAVCGGSTGCTDDALEPNDTLETPTLASMTSYADLQICGGNSDFFRIDGAFRDLVTVTIDGFDHDAGDLDLRLLSPSGTIVASSASTMDRESASFCLGDTGRVFAQVLGYMNAQNAYDLSITRAPLACCSDDTFEPDDTRATARRLTTRDFEGTICPDDDDYVAFTVTGASAAHVEILFDAAIGDLDLELQGPDGARIAISEGTGDSEVIDASLPAAGTYYVRVHGFSTAANTYVGEVTTTPITTCTTTRACASGEVCDAGTCRSDACASDAMCPSSHLCPVYGPGSAARHCGATCTVNSDCRSTEACKWFAEGRACGVRGAGANGAACADATACGGQRACLAWPGGYCARAGCRTNADCESGTFCVTTSGVSACVLECESDVERCRDAEGYACDFVDDVGGTLHLACVPAS
ncbi:PPC domain-containing protein [Sandaracinus amylolyticus]|uniref:PPC domain-containing protein n=1 Tax=Sandaracinus amylolyticus TaxID=927083 RepID=UPI001F24C900|nr:PPC domain-containing protein [Sandaracinus amylolyticus]UJR82211.1 Hypothetical protein I5071_42760 [Sandaracinus amylolyticus]